MRELRSVGAEIAVKQHILAHTEMAAAGAKSVGYPVDPRQHEGRPTRSHNNWRECELQPIELAFAQEPRDGVAAAFHENAVEPNRAEPNE